MPPDAPRSDLRRTRRQEGSLHPVGSVELEIYAQLDGVQPDVHLVGYHDGASGERETGILAAEVHVGVFDPGRDAVGEGVLEAKAGDPADMRVTAAEERDADDADIGIYVSPGDTCHRVQQRAVHGDT